MRASPFFVQYLFTICARVTFFTLQKRRIGPKNKEKPTNHRGTNGFSIYLYSLTKHFQHLAASYLCHFVIQENNTVLYAQIF